MGITPRHKPTLVKPVLAVALVLVAAVTAAAQSAAPDPTIAFDWREAWLQGGAFGLALILGWSYRKDMATWADQRVAYEKQIAELRASVLEDKIAFQQARVDEAMRYNRNLEQIVITMNETVKGNTAALTDHHTAVARNTDSTHRLANAVERLESK